MDFEPKVSIIAIITTEKEKISGGAPIFISTDREEMQEISTKLESIMDAAAHEINLETIIIVKH